MWTANITDKNYQNGVLTITVSYTDGASTVSESIDVTGGSPEVISQKISNRLNTLNTTADLAGKIIFGAFTPTVVTPSPEDVLAEARRKLIAAKQDVDLGLIASTDQTYVEAFSTAQTALAAVATVETVTAQPVTATPATL